MQGREHWLAWPLERLNQGAASSSRHDSLYWWALEFSPRVAVLEEALLMETSMVQRLWGGLQPMLERLDEALNMAYTAYTACTARPAQPERAYASSVNPDS